MAGLSGRIFVTGGTGSLGKATLLLAEREGWNAEFIIFSRDEAKQSKLRKQFPQHTYILGDVAKKDDVRSSVRGIRPKYILHYAAYKMIPSSQVNSNATIWTNIVGSQNVVEAALEYGVNKVIASSTDKACQSINFYGASKLIMEGVFQDANKWGTTSFHLARYGNVVSSNSSVVPFFREQIAKGGPVTITDLQMTRFWISLREAVDLILRASKTSPGVIVVPKAPVMSVWDVANCLIGETGKGGQVKIQTIGIRAGEKIHESMVSEAESYHTEEGENHFYIYPPNSKVKTHDVPFSYTTENASRELTDDGFLELIRESKELGS